MVDCRRWCLEHRAQLDRDGITCASTEVIPGRSKPSQTIELQRGRYMAQVIVWSSGECEVLLGGAVAQVRTEQHRVTSQSDLDALMLVVVEHVRADGGVTG